MLVEASGLANFLAAGFR